MPPTKKNKGPAKDRNVLKEKQKVFAGYTEDFDKQVEQRVAEIEREGASLLKQIQSLYVQETFKLSKQTREMNFEEFLKSGKGDSLMVALNNIEEQVNNAVLLPTIGQKLRSVKKDPMAGLPPSAPKSTARKKRINADIDSTGDEANTAVVVKQQVAVQVVISAPTPYPVACVITKPPIATPQHERTLDFDANSPEANTQHEVTDGGDGPKIIRPKIAAKPRQLLENEIAYSKHGTPIMMDPMVLVRNKIRTTIAVDSVTSKIESIDRPNLDKVDVEQSMELRSKLVEMIANGGNGASSNVDPDQQPSTSSSK